MREETRRVITRSRRTVCTPRAWTLRPRRSSSLAKTLLANVTGRGRRVEVLVGVVDGLGQRGHGGNPPGHERRRLETQGRQRFRRKVRCDRLLS